jgi:hypothetical protein
MNAWTPPEQQVQLEYVLAPTQQLHDYWNTYDQAALELNMLGFQRVQQPQYTLPLLDPQALTTMNLHQFAETHARYVGWHNYAENTLAIILATLVQIDREIKQLTGKLYIESAEIKNAATGKPYSLDDRKVWVEQNQRLVELARQRTHHEQQKILMESYTTGIGKWAALISRHIELRKLDIESARTGHNMPSRGMYPHP